MWVRKLSTALGLVENDQDWGICNADPSRVLEFIQFYKNNSVDDPWEPEALSELIFQSMNDAMEESRDDDELHDQFCAFIKTHASEFPKTLRYWISLSENEEFPIAKIVRKESA